MIAIGFLTALFFIQRESKRAGIDPEVIGNAAFWSLLIGIAGTRLLHIIMFPQYYSWTDPIGWIAIWRGGLVFQGGPPAVLIFLYFYLKKHGIQFTKVADISAPFLALGHGIGRVGCFLNGCCYGKETSGILGVSFRRFPFSAATPPTGSPPFLDQYQRGELAPHALWSHPVYPTQLFSTAGLILICVLLLLIRRKWHPFDGFMLPIYFVFYGVFRFIVEFYRGDHNPTHFGTLSDQQILCIVFVVFGFALFFAMKHYLAKPAAEKARSA